MLISSHPPLLLFILPLTFLFLYFFETVSHRWSEHSGAHLFGETLGHSRHTNKTSSHENITFDTAFEGGSRFTQVSMQFGQEYDVTIERALKTHIEHGNRWDYSTHVLRQNIFPSGGIYSKLAYLMTTMVNEMAKPVGQRSEWLVWFDADTVLTNPNIPWSLFVPPSERILSEFNLLVTQDWFGFNAGVFLIRVCEWSIQLLADSVALPRLDPKRDLPFAEQSALQQMFDTGDRIHRRLYVPRHWFNVYDDTNAPDGEVTYPGSMLVHFPALGYTRYEAMGAFLDELERDPSELQMPLSNTSYLAETAAFWSHVSEAMHKLQEATNFERETQQGNKQAYENHKDLFRRVNEAAETMTKTIIESSDDKQKMREKYLKLERELHWTQEKMQKIIDGTDRKEEEEEKKAQQEAEEKEKQIQIEKEKEKEKEHEQGQVQKQEEERKDSDMSPEDQNQQAELKQMLD